jgi:hypothetical protein
MHVTKNKGQTATLLGFLFFWTGLLGCATAPALITERSGDTDFTTLLESIRVKGKLPALSGAVIIDGKYFSTVTAVCGNMWNQRVH